LAKPPTAELAIGRVGVCGWNNAWLGYHLKDGQDLGKMSNKYKIIRPLQPSVPSIRTKLKSYAVGRRPSEMWGRNEIVVLLKSKSRWRYASVLVHNGAEY
jgi:hypothetical protein